LLAVAFFLLAGALTGVDIQSSASPVLLAPAFTGVDTCPTVADIVNSVFSFVTTITKEFWLILLGELLFLLGELELVGEPHTNTPSFPGFAC
jgi:hypothetical protein